MTTTTTTKTLYELSLTATCLAIDPRHNVDSVDEIYPIDRLCRPLRLDVCKELKHLWMNRQRQLPSRRRLFEYRYLDFNTLDKYDFIMLVHHPRHAYPEFWPSYTDTAHIYSDYYEYWLGNEETTVPHLLCRPCFVAVSCTGGNDDDPDFDYYEYWTSVNWKFYNTVKHFGVTAGGFVKDVLRSESSWCDRCVLSPLFQLYDWQRCGAETDVHACDNESDSDDSIVTTYERRPLIDPYVG